jgi:uncharacterized protein involved in outer membrane biogenesis
MILTLSIDQLAPGSYRAVVMDGDVEVSSEHTVHSSVALAIAEAAAAVPDGFAILIEPRYAGISAGTLRIIDARRAEIAEAAARSIMTLVAELHANDDGR